MSTLNFDPKKYWEDRLSNDFALQGVGYSSLGSFYNELMYRVRKVIFFRLKKRFAELAKSNNILDVGSGTGFYLDLWSKMNADNKITASDITEKACSEIKKRFEVPVYQFDISDKPPMELIGIFDVVSAFDIMFHIVDDTKYDNALKNVSLLLRKDGLFIFSDNFLHKDRVAHKHHISRSLDEISKMLQATGFEILDRRPMFVLMNQPVDTSNIFLQKAWSTLTWLAHRYNFLGAAIGGVLYFPEILLTKICKESPTTEIVVCRKK